MKGDMVIVAEHPRHLGHVKVKVLSKQGAEGPLALHITWNHIHGSGRAFCWVCFYVHILHLGIPQIIDAEHYVPYLGRYNVQDLRVSMSNPLAYMSLVTNLRTLCAQDVAHLL